MTRTGLAVCALVLGTVLLSGCGDVRAVPGAAYDRAVSYFDRWAQEREPEPASVADGLRDYAPTAHSATVAKPVRVEIPSVGIASDLERLGLAGDGAIETPDDWASAGWYRGGPRPGQQGAAVILGHVDSTTGPAVFYRLRQLEPGDRITVERADGTAAIFEVDRVEQHGKTRFPTDEVYYPTPEPTLRLVTCGGAFDTEARSYTDNVVVFARLAADAA
ncbi:MAG: class F sortase [Actinobacteria bacterium]|nr:class F sortase [Actinomycetota bacterium]